MKPITRHHEMPVIPIIIIIVTDK